MARPLLVLLACLALVTAACGDDDDDGGASSGGSTDSAQGADKPSEPTGSKPRCREVPPPEPQPDGGEKKPKAKLDPAATYRVTLATNCGEIVIQLDQKTAPNTAASFASLVESGFYDGTLFHRIVPGFVIQGGDPTGTGTGGPGYSVRDVPPKDAAYTEGVVAMAKTQVEPAGTSGSQFYIVTGADAGLPPDYALLGRVKGGDETLEKLDAVPNDPADNRPTEPVVIEDVEIREG